MRRRLGDGETHVGITFVCRDAFYSSLKGSVAFPYLKDIKVAAGPTDVIQCGSGDETGRYGPTEGVKLKRAKRHPLKAGSIIMNQNIHK